MPPQKRITPLKWMLTFVIVAGLMVITTADEKTSTETKTVDTSSPPPSVSISSTPRDEIYIDDEGLEGSGGRGEIHDDLEKESDYSGSGFGPDDEDSATGHHSSSSNTNQNNRQSSIGGGQQNINRQDTINRNNNKDHQTRISEYDLGNTGNNNLAGSGDGDNDDDNDDDDDDDDDDYEHGIIDNDDNDNIHHTSEKIDHDGSHIIDPYEKHDDKTNDFIDVDNDNNNKIKIDDKSDKDDNDNDDEHDIYTDVTDINDSDEIIPDRSDSNKDLAKANNEIDLDLDHRNSGTDLNTNSGGNDVSIMNTKAEDRTTSFFAQPGILAAVIGGAVVGLLCAILVVMFIVYRMRKKDEGSYALDEPKRSPAVNSYAKNGNNREFYA